MRLQILRPRVALVGVLGLACVSGCDNSTSEKANDAATTAATASGEADQAKSTAKPTEAETAKPAKNEPTGTAAAADVDAAKARIAALGAKAKMKLQGSVLSEIMITDGSELTADDIALFGRLTDLQKLQILNCRMLNDEMVKGLANLKELTSLSLTNTVINDPTVELISKSFPKLTELDLSSNTNMTTGVMKILGEMTQLKSLTLVQNRFNELSTRKLKALKDLKSLDLRGNMEAGNMTLGIVGELPNLTSFKHRSTAVTDEGMAKLANNASLENLLIQDFMISSQSGEQLAKLKKLNQLEVFRCQGFGSDGVLALKGLQLERLTLRDLPSVDDQAMKVFADLPKLKKLYLHELDGVSDEGLKNLASLASLELLDVWSVQKFTDASIDVIAALPNLKELSLRTTGVTDAAVDKVLAMPNLQSLTLKENSSISEEALKKLSSKKWAKLDTGAK